MRLMLCILTLIHLTKVNIATMKRARMQLRKITPQFPNAGSSLGNLHSAGACGGKCIKAECRAYTFDTKSGECRAYSPDQIYGTYSKTKEMPMDVELWTVTDFDEKDDQCRSSPCLSGGFCIDGNSDYHCLCTSGFAGRNCFIPRGQKIVCSAVFALDSLDYYIKYNNKVYPDQPNPEIDDKPECGIQSHVSASQVLLETIDITTDLTSVILTVSNTRSITTAWRAHTITLSDLPVNVTGFELVESSFKFVNPSHDLEPSFTESSVVIVVPEPTHMSTGVTYSAKFSLTYA